MSNIFELREQIRSCVKCNLCKKMPEGNKPVPGIGAINAELFIVGEALGADEALLEEPFVGLCGKFLTKCMEQAGLNRSKCYISNVVKCRPTDNGKKNRPPTTEEAAICVDWLYKEIDMIRPKLILTLGSISAYHIRMEKSIIMKQIAGTITEYKNYHYPNFTCKVFSTWHPSYIMVHGKKFNDKFIEHLQKVKKLVYDII